jgi:hypothetical protein
VLSEECSQVKKGDIVIHNAKGELVFRTEMQSGKHKIDIKELPSGVYFVIAAGQTGRFVRR